MKTLKFPSSTLLRLALPLLLSSLGCGEGRDGEEGRGSGSGGSGGGASEEDYGQCGGDTLTVSDLSEADGQDPENPLLEQWGDVSECSPRMLGWEVPANQAGDTSLSNDHFHSSCSKRRGPRAKEITFAWMAPSTGRYLFSSEGSSFDTVLSLREPLCENEGDNERKCNDDIMVCAPLGSGSGRAPQAPCEGKDEDTECRYVNVDGENVLGKCKDLKQSRLVVDLSRGEHIFLVVDGYQGGDEGSAQIAIERIEVRCSGGEDDDGDGKIDCDDPDCMDTPDCGAASSCPEEQVDGRCGPLPILREGRTTNNNPSALGGASCASDGGSKANEAVVAFVAPQAGPYRISSGGSNFDTILYVRDGRCSGIELACDDDGGIQKTSRVRLDLAEGQEIVVVVDGFDGAVGDYQLRIEGIEQHCEDGEDDDLDGDVDCEDDDCVSAECALEGGWLGIWGEMEDEVLRLTNIRRGQGATCANDVFGPADPLAMDEVIRLSARLHSLDMGERNFFEHDNLDGLSPFDRMARVCFDGAQPWGENIAAGQPTAADVVEGWMNSPGHCRNIMDPGYRVLGIGYAHTPGSDFGHYWTQNFGGGHGNRPAGDCSD